MKKKIEFETFREFGPDEINQLKSEAPSCFNGRVRVIRHRVTIEQIEEPDEIIKARLQKMWDECDNIHNLEPLRAAAKKYGLELKLNR